MLNTPKQPLITLLGPTASGKTALAVALAKQLNGEIISCDSRQVFRGMDIGTGKDLDEYQGLPYHLIDIKNPGEEYNLFEFAKDFSQSFTEISKRGNLPLLVGGTGMYLDATLRRYQLSSAPIDAELRATLQGLKHDELIERLNQLKPEQHNATDINDKERTIRALEIAIAEERGASTHRWPECASLVLGLQFPREMTRQRITTRLKQRLNEGMIEEVERLISGGVSHASLEHYGLEYRYLSLYLRGELSYNDMFQKLNGAIHQFAKQQEKWFRNIQKKGIDIHWLDTDADLVAQGLSLISSFLDHTSSQS